MLQEKLMGGDGNSFITLSQKRQVHLICGTVHVISSAALLGAGLGMNSFNTYDRSVSKSFFDIQKWFFMCYNKAAKTYTAGTQACPETDRMFYEDTATTELYKMNVLIAAAMYSFWSGLVHFIAAHYSQPTGQGSYSTEGREFTFFGLIGPQFGRTREAILRFSLDYAVTAPLMLSVFCIVFASNNLFSVIVGPIILALLLLASTLVLLDGQGITKPKRWFLLLVLCGLYAAVLGLSIIRSAVQVTSKTIERADNEGKAPDLVIVVSIFLILTFSSFIVPYAIELLMDKPVVDGSKTDAKIFLAYAGLSLIAKVTLHAMFGIAVINQSKFLQKDETQPPPNYSQEENLTFIAAGNIIGVGSIIFYLIYRRIKKQYTDASYSSVRF